MPLEAFEPAWKKNTTSIRRTLHIVTQIRDEFLNSAGNVIKEVRFEKRSLQQPVTIIPGWVARKVQHQQEESLSLTNTQESSVPWSPPLSHPALPSKEVQRERHQAFVPETIEIPVDESIETASDASSECSDANSFDVDIKKFAFWDYPKWRTTRGMKSIYANKLFIPVYIFSSSNKPGKVNVIVNIEGTKRKAARRVDLIYLWELEPGQIVRHWNSFRVGDNFPSARGVSDQGVRDVAINDAKLDRSDQELNLFLTSEKAGKSTRQSKMSFWNCVLPASFGSRRPQTQSTVLLGSYKNLAPQAILETKRGRFVTASMQGIVNDLGDPEDDETASKRSRMSSRPSASSSLPQDASKELEYANLYSQLTEMSPCKNLFSGYVFAKILEKTNEESLALDDLIRTCNGKLLTAQEVVDRSPTSDKRVVIADRYHRKMVYAQALSEGIPIVNMNWLIDCLSNRKIVDFDQDGHLVKTELMTGFKCNQPYQPNLSAKSKPFKGHSIALGAESMEFCDKICRISENLGAKFLGNLNFSDEQQLESQVRNATHVVMVLEKNMAKLDQLLSFNLKTPILKMDWFLDCVGANEVLPPQSNAGYSFKKRN